MKIKTIMSENIQIYLFKIILKVLYQSMMKSEN